VVVQNGDFGSRFGWYVDVIKRTVSQNWYSQLADPKASMGHSVVVTFTVHRDGSVSDPRIAQSSGVSSLDLSAIQAVERVNAFGPLPNGYSGSSVSVAYTFTYDQSTRQ
jgi:protein TonB